MRTPRKPPLRRCPACGCSFRSWADERYCNRRVCIDARTGRKPDGNVRVLGPGDLPDGF